MGRGLPDAPRNYRGQNNYRTDEISRASITLSAGTEDDLFENRIRELVEGE